VDYTWKGLKDVTQVGVTYLDVVVAVSSPRNGLFVPKGSQVAVIVLRPLVIAVSTVRHITQYNTYGCTAHRTLFMSLSPGHRMCPSSGP
jgi:hypothetical protein